MVENAEEKVFAIESKTGGGTRKAAQLRKDCAASAEGARIGNNGGELRDTTMKLHTGRGTPVVTVSVLKKELLEALDLRFQEFGFSVRKPKIV